MHRGSQDHRDNHGDSSEEITLADLSPASETNHHDDNTHRGGGGGEPAAAAAAPATSSAASSTQPLTLTPAQSYSEGSDSGCSPSFKFLSKYAYQNHHFISQDSIIIEDDEDYEVMSDNELEDNHHHHNQHDNASILAGSMMMMSPDNIHHHHNLNDAPPQMEIDDVSFEGDADDEGGIDSTDEDGLFFRHNKKHQRRPQRQKEQQQQQQSLSPPPPPQSRSQAPPISSLVDTTTNTTTTTPLSPRRSHRQQMSELSALFERDRKKEHARNKSADNATSNNNNNTTTTASSLLVSPRPTTLLKYIRKWGKDKADITSTTVDQQQSPHPLSTGSRKAQQQQVGSPNNDDDSFGGRDPVIIMTDLLDHTQDEDDKSSDESSEWEYPRWDDLEWQEMPTLPLRFSNTLEQKKTPYYLDASLLTSPLTLDEADRFAWEHGMLLQAVLQLLAERDQVGVEGSIHSADNIWKKGPLKKLAFRGGKSKLSHQWKVKYVELRHGNLCYYEDNGQGRKMIHLRQSDSEVKASPPNKNHPGFVFELSVLGATTSYWMANSEEERQTWIKSIQSAMLGTDAPLRDVDLTPHQEALASFKATRTKLVTAESKDQYLEAIRMAILHEETLRVPIEWIVQQLEEQPLVTENSAAPNHFKVALSARKQLKSSIVDFWTKLDSTSFCLNGASIPRTTPLATERVIGALTRAFLEYDKILAEEEEMIAELTELQAVSYARNILSSVIKIKDQMHVLSAVHHLLDNPNLVIVDTEEEDCIVNLEVSPAGEELPDDLPPFADELSGWLYVRRNKQHPKSRKKRYAVLSGGVLSYYEAALPRPNGLRGQLVLNGATLEDVIDETGEADESFALTIRNSKEGLVLSFEHEADFAVWKDEIQEEIDILQAAAGETAHGGDSSMLHLNDIHARAITLGIATAVGNEFEQEMGDASLETPKHQGSHSQKKPTLLGSGASRLSRAAGKVAETAGKLTDEGIRIAKNTAAGSIRGGIRVAKEAISKTPGVKVVSGAVGRTVGRLRSSGKGGEMLAPGGVTLLKRHPSMQMLLNNTALADKREPTVQCVVQISQTFHVLARHDGNPHIVENWLTVNAKLYQAFLLRGGPSGRMAYGDALIEFDFIERTGNDEEDDDSDEYTTGICSLPLGLWRK
jgi:hypothetical protein